MDIKDQLAMADANVDKLNGDVKRLEDLVVMAHHLILEHHNASKPVEPGRCCPHCTCGRYHAETLEYEAIADEAARIRQRRGI